MAPKRVSTSVAAKQYSKIQKTKVIEKEENINIADAFKRVKKPKTKTVASKKEAEIDIPSIQAILESFDLNCDCGPIIGITRLDRLIRAEYFNLAVSDNVKNILKNQALLEEHPELNLNIWHDLEKLI